MVSTLLFGGIALCGVAATEGAEFSVERFDSAMAENPSDAQGEPGVASVSGSSTTAAAALGLAAPAEDAGLSLDSPSADVPLDATSQILPQSLTIPSLDSDELDNTELSNAEAATAAIELPDSTAASTSAEVASFDESGSHTEIETAAPAEDDSSELEMLDTDRQPFAAVGGITLYGPADAIRTAGFHESANTQALEMRELDSPLETIVMASRGRGTGGHTAADIAVYPDEVIYSPVTGTVVDARAYKLYCKYDDNVVIIQPDAAEDRQVKVLHLSGLLIENGDRVLAGKTPIASGPTPLPFNSQIDSYVEDSTRTHVHIETVDLDLVDATNSTVCP